MSARFRDLCVLMPDFPIWVFLYRYGDIKEDMEHLPPFLALCAVKSLVISEIPSSQRPVAQSFDVFFDLRLSKRWG